MKFGFRLTVTLLMLGAVLAFLGGKGLFFKVMPANDLYEETCDWDALHSGQHVQANVDLVFYPFIVYSRDGSDTKAVYYLPDYKSDAGIINYMGIEVKAKDFDKYNNLAELCEKYWLAGEDISYDQITPIPVDGYLRKMKDDELNYLKQDLKNLGYESSEFDDIIVPYVMVENNTPIASLGMLVGGIVLFAGGAVMAVFSFKK